MDDTQAFWMVYGLGQRQPTVRHKTHHSALEEAKRLARKEPGIRFYVLEATGFAEKNDVRVVPLESPPMPPFDHPEDEVPW